MYVRRYKKSLLEIFEIIGAKIGSESDNCYSA
jgi:hypothetical protein